MIISMHVTTIIIILCGLSTAQLVQGGTRECGEETRCILLRQCPDLVKYLRQPTIDGITKVTKAHCGFQGNNPLVCCKKPKEETRPLTLFHPPNVDDPSTLSEVTTVPSTSTSTISENDFFPKNCGVSSITNRVFGGKRAPLGAYPWVVAFEYEYKNDRRVLCAGSLINQRYILTAAHCFDEKDIGKYKLRKIRLGEGFLSTNPDCERTRVQTTCAPPIVELDHEDVSIHPEYDTNFRYYHDIALVRLKQSVNYTAHIQPICLPPASLDIKRVVGDRSTTIAGWGHTENENKISEYLMEVKLPLQDHQVCQRVYPRQYSKNQLCVGGIKGEDSCIGDSGAPLVIAGPVGPPYLQLGLVSFGPEKCGLENVPAVYTSVTEFIPWIRDTMKPW